MSYSKKGGRKSPKPTGAYKKFDPELYAANDMPARSVILNHIGSQGIFCKENPDTYGPDLLIYSGYRPRSYVEVERKHGWRAGRDEFPFPTVQVPERKAKFLRLGLPIEFWVLREDLGMAVIVPDYVLERSPLVEVPNRLVESGEKFFQVPVEECIFVRIDNPVQEDLPWT